MEIKRAIGRTVPYPVIEGARKVLHYGLGKTCPVCNSHVRRFLSQGKGHPVLDELEVVGGMTRPNDVCPVCHANDRDRLIMHYLETAWLPVRRRPASVLHMAPEKGLSRLILTWPDIEYVAGDIEPGRYRHLRSVKGVNLLDLPFADRSFDLLLCNHVLEHLVDDGRAMREIRRVLRPEGIAILQVPLAMRLETTREGDGSETEAEKIYLYGQKDHVRMYAPGDYRERLEAAGLAVELYDASRQAPDAVAALSLNPREILHVCRPAAPC